MRRLLLLLFSVLTSTFLSRAILTGLRFRLSSSSKLVSESPLVFLWDVFLTQDDLVFLLKGVL